ncbi:hypothetical protein [Reyranella sp.]|uniref:bestrophin-like domain n=1 Tax=Reyranella sp. TaxID=1929291 RepID=UPI003BA86914
MAFDIDNHSLLAIFLASLVLIGGAGEAGHWLGVRAARQGAAAVSTLEGAILGLLALLIGFTFSMALSRFEARRDGAVSEAAAIGTTALRARLLPAPHDRESVTLLREYVQIRLDLARGPIGRAEFDRAIARSNLLQEALWRQAQAVAAKDNAMVPTGLFIQSLNEMIDDQEKRLSAMTNRLPLVVIVALYAMCVMGIGFAGYGSGVESKRTRVPVHITGILVATMVLLIQDIDRPGSGYITVSQQPLVNAAAAIDAFPAGRP